MPLRDRWAAHRARAAAVELDCPATDRRRSYFSRLNPAASRAAGGTEDDRSIEKSVDRRLEQLQATIAVRGIAEAH